MIDPLSKSASPAEFASTAGAGSTTGFLAVSFPGNMIWRGQIGFSQAEGSG